MDEFANQHNFIAWFETSAKENIGITPAFMAVVSYLLEHDPATKKAAATEGALKLDLASPVDTAAKTCGC